MKLKKQNVIYTTEDLGEIKFLKEKGFKEFKPKSKLELNENKGNPVGNKKQKQAIT